MIECVCGFDFFSSQHELRVCGRAQHHERLVGGLTSIAHVFYILVMLTIICATSCWEDPLLIVVGSLLCVWGCFN